MRFRVRAGRRDEGKGGFVGFGAWPWLTLVGRTSCACWLDLEPRVQIKADRLHEAPDLVPTAPLTCKSLKHLALGPLPPKRYRWSRRRVNVMPARGCGVPFSMIRNCLVRLLQGIGDDSERTKAHFFSDLTSHTLRHARHSAAVLSQRLRLSRERDGGDLSRSGELV